MPALLLGRTTPTTANRGVNKEVKDASVSRTVFAFRLGREAVAAPSMKCMSREAGKDAWAMREDGIGRMKKGMGVWRVGRRTAGVSSTRGSGALSPTGARPSTGAQDTHLPPLLSPSAARGTLAPHVHGKVAWLSSIRRGARPTGWAFRGSSVGLPGGAAFSVCQGALVLAEGQGQCWVRLSEVLAIGAMANMATAAGGTAMVERDGAAVPRINGMCEANVVASPRGPTSTAPSPIIVIAPMPPVFPSPSSAVPALVSEPAFKPRVPTTPLLPPRLGWATVLMKEAATGAPALHGRVV